MLHHSIHPFTANEHHKLLTEILIKVELDVIQSWIVVVTLPDISPECPGRFVEMWIWHAGCVYGNGYLNLVVIMGMLKKEAFKYFPVGGQKGKKKENS